MDHSEPLLPQIKDLKRESSIQRLNPYEHPNKFLTERNMSLQSLSARQQSIVDSKSGFRDKLLKSKLEMSKRMSSVDVIFQEQSKSLFDKVVNDDYQQAASSSIQVQIPTKKKTPKQKLKLNFRDANYEGNTALKDL